MKKILWIVWCCLVLLAVPVFAACPLADLTGDCRVGIADFAVFAGQWMAEGSYTLHVNSSGALGVSIASGTGHDGTTNYAQTLTVGTRVILTAPATAGGELFMDWTGDANSIDQTLSFSMNADKTVTANYVPLPEDLVIIPAGTFQMGNSTNAEEGRPNELPIHMVTLDSFAMGKYEITNGQYCAFLNSAYLTELKVVDGIVYAVGDTPNSFPYCDTATSSSDSRIVLSNNTFSVQTKGGRDMSDDPMVLVSWYGTAAYCNWRSRQEGKQSCYDLSTWNCDFTNNGYRLPTEAEWEYAARGGLSGNRFPWGSTISHNQANYQSNWEAGKPLYVYDVNPTPGYHPAWNDGIDPYTAPVGSFTANGYGVYDMAGNVWEWCNDWWSDTYYGSSPQMNPTGPATGADHVFRGGSWDAVASGCRVSFRHYYNPSARHFGFGFRVVLDY